MRAVLTVLGLLVVGLAAAVGGWFLVDQTASQAQPAASARAGGGRPAPVELATAARGRAADLVVATGSLRSSDSVTIRPEIDGSVSRIAFDAGQRVTAGEVLIELDRVTLLAELEKAEAALALARGNSERAETLARRGATSASASDDARAALRTATAEVELAKVRLDKTRIRAPFDGVIGLRSISVGLYAQAGQELARIDRIDPIDLDFRVSERRIAAIRPGQTVQVGVDAVPGRTFEGTVQAIDPVIDPNTRSALIRARIANPEGVLHPGLFARVTVEVDPRDSVLVPEAAVVQQPGGGMVYRVTDGKAAAVTVRTGMRRDGMVEIREGLAEGDRIVVNGQVRLRDGAQVTEAAPGAGT